jgi:hypothetical protein
MTKFEEPAQHLLVREVQADNRLVRLGLMATTWVETALVICSVKCLAVVAGATTAVLVHNAGPRLKLRSHLISLMPQMA